jgi:hypothetical protein
MQALKVGFVEVWAENKSIILESRMSREDYISIHYIPGIQSFESVAHIVVAPDFHHGIMICTGNPTSELNGRTNEVKTNLLRSRTNAFCFFFWKKKNTSRLINH